MVTQTGHLTLQAFDAFIARPENQDRLFEYIGGEIFEVVSNPLSSKIAATMNGYLFMYLDQNDTGHLTGADGSYMVAGERYSPDVAFISYARQQRLDYRDGYVPQAPDLAVEVLSPGNTDEAIAVKIANYLAAGTIVWVLNPTTRTIRVFRPGQPVQTLTTNDHLDGGELLPGFSVAVAKLFPAEDQDE